MELEDPVRGRKITHSYRVKALPIRIGEAMGFDKGHKEFHTLDLSEGWQTPPGYPDGIQQKIISGALDEKGKRGNRTRLLRFAPGVYTTAPFVHEYWEEVFLVSGDLIVGNDEQGKGGEKFQGHTYAVRAATALYGRSSRKAVVSFWRRISTKRREPLCSARRDAPAVAAESTASVSSSMLPVKMTP